MESFSIGDGINLHYLKTGKFKTLSCSFIIRSRLSLSKSMVTKTALLPMVLRRGSEKYKDMASIQIKQEELYGAIFDINIIKKGEEQLIQFYMECLDSQENVQETLLFIKEIAVNTLKATDAAFQEYVEGEKRNLKNKISARINNKIEYAKLRCFEEMCKDEPFGVYADGYYEHVDGIGSEELLLHYENLLKTAPIEIVMTGNSDTSMLVNLAKEIFDIKRCYKPLENTIIFDGDMETKNVTEKMNVIQGKFCMGIRVNNAGNKGSDYYSLLVANEIFGGGAESKLYKNIREESGLCYYINSTLYRFKSIILVQSGVDAGNFEKVRGLVTAQLENMKNGGFLESELEKAKQSLVKKMKSIEDYQSQIMDFYLTQKMIGDNASINEFVEGILSVKAQACSNIIKGANIGICYFLQPEA